jgi:hypothetical protein
MAFVDIICLANSRKYNARCVAGKDVKTSKFIRPISQTITGELSDNHIRLSNGSLPGIFDIIRVSIGNLHKTYYHPEDYYITGEIWEKLSVYNQGEIDKLIDNPSSLWINSNNNINDRIEIGQLKASPIETSLYFIKVRQIKITKNNESFKGEFVYNNTTYKLSITDFNITQPGNLEGNIYLCISIGEPFKVGESVYCFKIIATIIKL